MKKPKIVIVRGVGVCIPLDALWSEIEDIKEIGECKDQSYTAGWKNSLDYLREVIKPAGRESE